MSQFQVLLVRPVYSIGRFQRALPPKMPKSLICPMHHENVNEGEAGLYQLLIQHHRCRLHGGDRPHGQKVVGATWARRPQTNFVTSSVLKQ